LPDGPSTFSARAAPFSFVSAYSSCFFPLATISRFRPRNHGARSSAPTRVFFASTTSAISAFPARKLPALVQDVQPLRMYARSILVMPAS